MLKRGLVSRKGQSIMEFLMTYGWALIIIVIVVMGLFYFGVFSPKVKSSCTMEDPFFCRDVGLSVNRVTFIVDAPRSARVESFDLSVKYGEQWIDCPERFKRGSIKRSGSMVWCDLGGENAQMIELVEGEPGEAKVKVHYSNLEGKIIHYSDGNGRGLVEGTILATCGDNMLQSGEKCDGNQFLYKKNGDPMPANDATCMTYYNDDTWSGSLECNYDCKSIKEDGCYQCGNGVKESAEECDCPTGVCSSSQLGDKACTNLFNLEGRPFQYGTLGCYQETCEYDTTHCFNYECGNGEVEAGEECDCKDSVCKFGTTKTCGDLGYQNGALACTMTGANACKIDKTACYTCGNGIWERGSVEGCDGAQIPLCCDQNSVLNPECSTFRNVFHIFNMGGVTCKSDCTVDKTKCSYCGDGIVEGLEQCDLTNLAGKSCQSPIPPDYFGRTSGTLSCTSGCTYDKTGCYTCGDTVREGVEECDVSDYGLGTKLVDRVPGDGPANCADWIQSDNWYGSLICGLSTSTKPCKVITTMGNCIKYCGDGITQYAKGEQCDDGNEAEMDGCSSTCQCTYNTCDNSGDAPECMALPCSSGLTPNCNKDIPGTCCFHDVPGTCTGNLNTCSRNEDFISYLKLDNVGAGTSDLSPDNGDTTLDSSAAGNTGQVVERYGTGTELPMPLNGAPHGVFLRDAYCKKGKCYEFEQTTHNTANEYNAYVGVQGDSVTGETSGAFSVEMWFMVPTQPAPANGGFSLLTAGTNDDIQLYFSRACVAPARRFTYINSGETVDSVDFGTGMINCAATNPTNYLMPLGQWVYYAFTCGPSGKHVYVKKPGGTLTEITKLKSTNTVCPDYNFKVGSSHVGGHATFDGYIDNVLLYARELTMNEVSSHSGDTYDFCSI